MFTRGIQLLLIGVLLLPAAGLAQAFQSSSPTTITLNGASITVDGAGAVVEGTTVTIISAGDYNISGPLTDGQVIVNTQDEEPVRLILNGVELRSSTSAPIYIADAEEALIVLADGTTNTVTDSAAYVFASPDEDEPNAAVFSKSDLNISGNGTLIVSANYNDGIASKDGLTIASGTITVNALDDGIRGKDYLVVQSGTITVNAQGDGLKSDNEEDAALGYISIENGVLNITAGGDAFDAQTNVHISAGDFVITSGGGASGVVDASTSAKGIKGTANVTIDGGTFTIDSADDAIHSNNSLIVNGGTFTISSGDDGMHTDATLEINSGDINITYSYEGIESAVITINGGNIHLVATDDGLNVAGGADSSGMGAMPGQGGGPGGRGGSGQDSFAASGDYFLYINGGSIVVDAIGDGIDVNGTIEMTGGFVLVNGPTEQMNGALDYDGLFTITGGFFVAVGSAGMAQAPGTTSSQYSLLLNLDSMEGPGTLIHIQASDGTGLLTFAPTKLYQSIAFSSPDFVAGVSYDVYIGGTSDGTLTDGLYQGGTYTPGTLYTSFTISDIVTAIGAARFR